MHGVTHSIFVQGIGDVNITESLDTCLRHRHETDTLTLWIDQVCINQKDTAEKAKQVVLMGDVYSNANKVVVWLGQAANGSDELIDLLLKFGKRPRTGAWTTTRATRSTWRSCARLYGES